MAPSPIQFYEYSPAVAPERSSCATPEWCSVSASPEQGELVTSFSVVTWNVWFDKLEQHTRFSSALNELLALHSADLVCLQDATPQFIKWLQLSPEIRANWLLTDCWDADHQLEMSRQRWVMRSAICETTDNGRKCGLECRWRDTLICLAVP